MVLSNKKLKEKLRATKAKLLAGRIISGETPDSKDEEQLKTVLESVTQKLKSSKKRRKRANSSQEDRNSNAGGCEEDEGLSEKRGGKKRKKGDGLEMADSSLQKQIPGEERHEIAPLSAAKALKRLKREQRREKAKSLQESCAGNAGGGDGSEILGEKMGKKEDGLEMADSSLQKQVSGEERREIASLSAAKALKRLKREQRREKAKSLQETSAGNGAGGDGSEILGERKRKRGDEDGFEGKVEVKKAVAITPKKKKKKKTKKKKKSEGEEMAASDGVKEGVKVVEEVAPPAIPVSESKGNADVSTKVYVGGIPYYSSEDDIRSFFEGCGTITEVDCMIFPDTGKFRGIAIITFKTEAAAKRALALDGSDMGGLFLKVQPYNAYRAKNKVVSFSPEAVEGYNRVYMGNLSWEITEDDLRSLFSGCQVTSIRFGEDKETGAFKGYAHVDFADSLSLDAALKLDQRIVCGRPVRISRAVPKKSSDGEKTRATTHERNEPFPPQNPVVGPLQNDIPRPSAPPVEASGAKVRRRTCYECGERGHESSACPKKPVVTDTQVESFVNAKATGPKRLEVGPRQDEAVEGDTADAPPSGAGEEAAVSAKIRGRRCYECGERGHLSTACSKKQAVE